jgi:hypothetical protein
MRKPWRMAVVCAVLAIPVAFLIPAVSGERPAFYRYSGRLVAGGYGWEFNGALNVVPVAETGPFTGFAFGPGRAELAYCAPAGDGGSALWVASVLLSERGLDLPESGKFPRRRLWSAPAGATLRGPIWWAPNGTQIAVRACTDSANDLVIVDYVTGDAAWVTQGKQVEDAAWAPSANQLAYVMAADGAREVWLWGVGAANGRRLGDGGVNLRWSLDGKELVWLRPQPGPLWTEMVWKAGDAQAREGERRPARPDGALWSPDGLWCAAATGEGDSRQLVVYRSNSPRGEEIGLPSAPVKQLLGWSPDSSMLLILTADNRPLATAIGQLPDEVKRLLSTEGALFSAQPAAIAGWPIEVAAGPPSWSSTAPLMLAYVAGKYPNPVEVAEWGLMNADWAGSLVVGLVQREYLGPPDKMAYTIERRQLMSNMKNVALAINMYVTDWDRYLLAEDTEQAMGPLDEYMGSRSYWMRPGVKGEVAVKYLVPPGVSVSWFRDNGVDPAQAPVAITDYPSDYFVVAYADGHVRTLSKNEWEFDGSVLRHR